MGVRTKGAIAATVAMVLSCIVLIVAERSAWWTVAAVAHIAWALSFWAAIVMIGWMYLWMRRWKKRLGYHKKRSRDALAQLEDMTTQIRLGMGPTHEDWGYQNKIVIQEISAWQKATEEDM